MQNGLKTNNYSISILLTLLGSVGLTVAITLLHALDLGGLSEWLLDLTYGSEAFLFISQMISGDGYLFQFVDKLTENKTIFEKIGEQIRQVQVNNTYCNIPTKQESFLKRLFTDNTFIGLTVGVLSAVGLTAAEVILHVATPFGSLGTVLSHTVMLVSNLSLCGGLGNRTGRASGYFKNATDTFRSKDVNYALSIAGGILVGVTVVALVIGLLGVTAISGGSALPVILFAASVIGGCASASGYIGRLFDFILGNRTIVGAIKDEIELKEISKSSAKANQPQPKPEPIKNRVNKENVLTAVGIGIGIVIGVTLIVAGLITLPFFGAGLPKLVAGFIVVTTCISAGGGLGNRLGFALDRKSWKFWEWSKKPKDNLNDPQQNVQTINIEKPALVANLVASPTTNPSNKNDIEAAKLINKPTSDLVDPSKQSSNTVYGRFFRRSQSVPNLAQYKKAEQPSRKSKFFKNATMPDLRAYSSNDVNFAAKAGNKVMQHSVK